MWRTLPGISGKRRAAAVHLLCSMQLHAVAFVAALVDVMNRVIPSRRILFDWADDQGRQQRRLIEGPLDAVAACRCFDRYHNQDETHLASTRDMVFNVGVLIAYITSIMTLEPGDLIFTGTPEGVSALTVGCTTSVELAGWDLGVLTNPVV